MDVEINKEDGEDSKRKKFCDIIVRLSKGQANKASQGESEKFLRGLCSELKNLYGLASGGGSSDISIPIFFQLCKESMQTMKQRLMRF